MTIISSFLCSPCRIGLALTSAGRNPGATGGAASINAGIANLPVTAKTDIANRLVFAQIARVETPWVSSIKL